MKYKIKTISKQTNYPGSSIFERIIEEFDIEDSFIEDDDVSTIESYSEGKLSVVGDDVKLSYLEHMQNNSESGTETTLSFSKSKPNEIVVTRTGEISSIMVFSQGERNICVYNTEIMPFELCLYTKSVNNRLFEEGYIEIVYFVEIKGACAQKTILKTEIEKI